MDTKLLHPVSRDGGHDEDDEVLVQGEWPCLFCDWHCENEKAMRSHRRVHNLQQCTKGCDKVFPANSHHFKKCGHQSIKKCDKCIFETNDAARLREHKQNYHTNPFECTSCDQRFKSENKLEMHEFTVHSKRFQCTHCDKTFPYRHTRDRHVQGWVYIYIYIYLFPWSPESTSMLVTIVVFPILCSGDSVSSYHPYHSHLQ